MSKFLALFLIYFAGLSHAAEDVLPPEIQSCLVENKIKQSCTKRFLCQPSKALKCDRTKDGKIIPVSVLKESDIKNILSEALGFDYVDYAYVEGACYNRSQDLSLHLYLKLKITTGQMYLEGDLQYGSASWGMHTAPYVYIRTHTGLTRVILDPAVGGTSVLSLQRWLSLISENPGSITKKEIYGPLYLINSAGERHSYSHPELSHDLLRSFKNVHENSLRTGSAK